MGQEVGQIGNYCKSPLPVIPPTRIVISKLESADIALLAPVVLLRNRLIKDFL